MARYSVEIDGKTFDVDADSPGDAAQAAHHVASAAPKPVEHAPTVLENMGSGVLEPFQNLLDDAKRGYQRKIAEAEGPLPSLPEAARRSVADLTGSGKFIMDTAAALPTAATNLLTRPVAGLINKLPVRPLTVENGKVRALEGIEGQRAIEEGLNTALSGARPSSLAPIPRPAPAAKPMDLEGLRDAKTAAYQAVDTLGAKFKPGAFKGLVNQIEQSLTGERFDADFHPATAKMLQKLQGKAKMKHSPTLSELDDLRKFVGENVSSAPNPTEQRLGRVVTSAIDAFIDGAGPGDMVTGSGPDASAAVSHARDMNTRFRKVKAVTDAVEGAKDRAGVTGSGGNVENATRQRLLQVQNKTKNLTPDEQAAFQRLVRGTKGQDALRLVGKLSPQGNGLMAALNIGATMANPAMGLMGLAGVGAKAGAEASTARKVEDLLKLMAVGGDRAALPGRSPLFGSLRWLGSVPAAGQLQHLTPSEEVHGRPRSRAGERAR